MFLGARTYQLGTGVKDLQLRKGLYKETAEEGEKYSLHNLLWMNRDIDGPGVVRSFRK